MYTSRVGKAANNESAICTFHASIWLPQPIRLELSCNNRKKSSWLFPSQWCIKENAFILSVHRIEPRRFQRSLHLPDDNTKREKSPKKEKPLFGEATFTGHSSGKFFFHQKESQGLGCFPGKIISIDTDFPEDMIIARVWSLYRVVLLTCPTGGDIEDDCACKHNSSDDVLVGYINAH